MISEEIAPVGYYADVSCIYKGTRLLKHPYISAANYSRRELNVS
jgi:hypothetical protein